MEATGTGNDGQQQGDDQQADHASDGGHQDGLPTVELALRVSCRLVVPTVYLGSIGRCRGDWIVRRSQPPQRYRLALRSRQ